MTFREMEALSKANLSVPFVIDGAELFKATKIHHQMLQKAYEAECEERAKMWGMEND